MGRLRPSIRRSGNGRRARRLVRRHGAVPASARPADPAHRDHPEAQGSDRPQPRRVRRDELPDERGHRRTPARRRHRPAYRRLAGRPRPTPNGRARRSADVVEGTSRCSTTRRSRPGSNTSFVPAIRRRPAAPLVGRAVDLTIEGGHHQRLLDAVLVGLGGFLDDNRGTFRRRLYEESPWWVPEAIDDRVLRQDLRRRRSVHHRRTCRHRTTNCARAVDTRVDRLRRSTQRGPGAAREGRGVEGGVARPSRGPRAGSSRSGSETKQGMHRRRRRSGQRTAHAGSRRARNGSVSASRTEPELQRKVDDWVAAALGTSSSNYRTEVSDLIASTVAKWDGDVDGRRSSNSRSAATSSSSASTAPSSAASPGS